MQSLKSTPTNKAAGKRAQISSLGVPAIVGVGLLIGFVAILAFVHSWRWIIALVCSEFVVLVAVRLLTSRDHNIFRRLRLWVMTKLFSRDSDIWNGVTYSSFPTYPSRTPRGMF